MSLGLLIPLLIVIAIAVSALGSISGVGGGVLFVPILMLVLNNLEIEQIKFISTILVFVGAAINVGIEIYKKRLNYLILIVGSVIAIPSIILGRYLNSLIDATITSIIIIVLLSIVSIALILTEYVFKRKQDIKTEIINLNQKTNFYQIRINEQKTVNAISIAMIAFVGGLITSLTGMGGGPLLMPALLIICKLTMKEAAPISHSLIMVASAISLIFGYEQFSDTQLLLQNVSPMLLGVVIGVGLAIAVKPYVKKEIWIKWILIILIWLSIIKIILDLTNVL